MLSIVVVLWYRGNNNVDDPNQQNQSLLPYGIELKGQDSHLAA